MNKPKKESEHFFASCPSGAEAILKKEISDLGLSQIVEQNAGILFSGPTIKALELILTSRVASKVYKKLYSFDVKNEKDLYFEAKKIKWKAIFKLNQSFRIQTILGNSPNGKKRSHFTNSLHLSLVLKDAVVDWFRDKEKKRPDVDTYEPEVSFLQYIAPHDNPYSSKEEVSILLDLCGTSLGDRGYREKGSGAQAPMRENLAASLLLSVDTDLKTMPFFDTMCGSATMLIEAALIKGAIPPSFIKLKSRVMEKQSYLWAFESHLFFDKDDKLKEAFEQLCQQYFHQWQEGVERLKAAGKCIWGIDEDEKSVALSRKHLRKIGLYPLVSVEKGSALKARPRTDQQSLIFCNPPYGERMGEESQLEELYHQYGENLKHNFKGHLAYVFTGNPNLAKKISLRTSKRLIFFNGNIECRLLEYQLY